MESEECKARRAKAIAKLSSGESLAGKDGAFAPFFKEFLETTLQQRWKPIWMFMNSKTAISVTVRVPSG